MDGLRKAKKYGGVVEAIVIPWPRSAASAAVHSGQLASAPGAPSRGWGMVTPPPLPTVHLYGFYDGVERGKPLNIQTDDCLNMLKNMLNARAFVYMNPSLDQIVSRTWWGFLPVSLGVSTMTLINRTPVRFLGL